jgi:arylamine N-acetyltransferase
VQQDLAQADRWLKPAGPQWISVAILVERHPGERDHVFVRKHVDREHLFTETARRREEFAPMCLYHQTSPESHFTRKRVCSLATPDGRVTLSDMRLIVTRGGERTERLLADDAEYAATLRNMFGVELDAA